MQRPVHTGNVPSSHDARSGKLQEELRYAADRRLPQVFRDVAADRDKYPTLAGVVETVESSLWAEDPTRALLVVMRRAVATLPDKTAKGCAEGCTWRQLGRLHYFGSEEDSSLQSYDDYVAAAKTYSGVPWAERTFRRNITNSIRQKLVDVLLDMEQQAIRAREQALAAADQSTTELSPSGLECPFIPRPSLDEHFTALGTIEESGSRWRRPDVICVVGEPGTGKTRYVKELPVASTAVWINAESADVLSVSLARVLESYDIPASSLDTPGLKREFGKLLERQGSPKLVVIDGIHDPQEIDGFVPHVTQARLIITSRIRPTEDDWSPTLHVGGMEADEATAMVSSLQPVADDREAATLAACLGNRPIAIEQACAFLNRYPSFTTADLVGSLAHDTTVTLSPLASRPGAALTVTYRQILKRLEEEHPTSYQLLRMLAFVPPLYVPRKLVMIFLARRLPIEEHERRFQELGYLTAVRPLQELCLLEERDSGIRLNSLTKEILWDLICPELEDIIEHYKSVTNALAEFELEDFGWSPAEIASFDVTKTLFSARLREVIATKAPPDEADGLLARRDKILTVDEWSALTDALWERSCRVAVVQHLLKFEDGTNHDDMLKLLQPHMDQVGEIAERIPDRDTWWARVHVFDFNDLIDWINRNEWIDRGKLLADIEEGNIAELVRLARIYEIGHAVWMLLADPIVETRLGQFDLREIYPSRNEPENRVSPFALSYPRVVLALEDDSEIHHAELVLQALGYSDAPELLRLIKLSDSQPGLNIWVSTTTMAIVSEKMPCTTSWRLRKPFTPLFIAANPGGLFATPEVIESIRSEVLDHVNRLLRAQGITRPNPDDLDELVNIQVWDESCYEFAHFTDEELADGIIAEHQTIDGWSSDELIAALRYWRERRQDIESVWMIGRWDEQAKQMTGKWADEVSKFSLGFCLWPTLNRKIEQVKEGTEIPVPPIVQVVNDAYHEAQRRRNDSFVLTELPEPSDHE